MLNPRKYRTYGNGQFVLQKLARLSQLQAFTEPPSTVAPAGQHERVAALDSVDVLSATLKSLPLERHAMGKSIMNANTQVRFFYKPRHQNSTAGSSRFTWSVRFDNVHQLASPKKLQLLVRDFEPLFKLTSGVIGVRNGHLKKRTYFNHRTKMQPASKMDALWTIS